MPEADAAGIRVHYLDIPAPGSPAAPLLLIHGAGGDHTVWGEQLAGLRGRARLVIPDLPGHGRSAPGSETTIAAYAATILRLIEVARVSRPVVAGHSMGGGVALQAALDRPDLFRGVVLVASAARLGVAARVFELIERDPAEAVRELARSAYGPDAPEKLIERGVATLSRSPAVLAADFRACNGFDVRDRVAELAVPLRILAGEADRLVFPKASEKLAALVPGARLRVVGGAGHLLMIERPAEVNAELLEFAESVGGGGSE